MTSEWFESFFTPLALDFWRAVVPSAVAESLLPQLMDERQLEAGGITYAVQNSYDALAGRLIQACTFTRGSERELAQTSQGVYTVAELHRLLQSQGWLTVAAYGSL